MTEADVEVESIKRVRHGLLSISLAFSRGCSDAEKLCKERITEAKGIGQNLNVTLSQIQNTIDRKKRDLEEAIQKQREHEQGKDKNSGGSSYFSTPKDIQEEIDKLKAMQRKGNEIYQIYLASYRKTVDKMDIFMNDFRKYSSGGSGGSDGDIDALGSNLLRMIDNIDRYVQTNFSSAAVASYNAAANQMNQQYQNSVNQTAMCHNRERTLGDD